jgi:hypothetical protein
MAMNFARLDCSCQDASSEPKKIYLDFIGWILLDGNNNPIIIFPF